MFGNKSLLRRIVALEKQLEEQTDTTSRPYGPYSFYGPYDVTSPTIKGEVEAIKQHLGIDVYAVGPQKTYEPAHVLVSINRPAKKAKR